MLKHKIRKAFNRAASSYDDHADLQRKVGLHLLQQITSHNFSKPNIIDLGCGTGITTTEIAKQFNFKTLHAIDTAEQLLQLTKSYQWPDNTFIYQKDFDQLTHSESLFDFVFSNLALHWSQDLLKLLTNIKKIMEPNGVLAFSIPLVGTFKELNNQFRLQNFFAAETILNHLSNVFSKVNHYQETYTYQFPNLSEALHSIKAVGANATNSPYRVINRQLFKNQTPQSLSYVIGYFIAQKE